MPITGEWGTQSQRPILKQGRNVTADVEVADIAAGAVTCQAISTGHVVSEKASDNLVTRSLSALIAAATSSGGGWSTTYTIWRTLVPIQVQRFEMFAVERYQHATNDQLTLYGNAGTSIGDIRLNAISTNLAAGTRVAGGNLNLVALPACTDITAKLAASTCAVPGAILVQIDYQTTG